MLLNPKKTMRKFNRATVTPCSSSTSSNMDEDLRYCLVGSPSSPSAAGASRSGTGPHMTRHQSEGEMKGERDVRKIFMKTRRLQRRNDQFGLATHKGTVGLKLTHLRMCLPYRRPTMQRPAGSCLPRRRPGSTGIGRPAYRFGCWLVWLRRLRRERSKGMGVATGTNLSMCRCAHHLVLVEAVEYGGTTRFK